MFQRMNCFSCSGFRWTIVGLLLSSGLVLCRVPPQCPPRLPLSVFPLDLRVCPHPYQWCTPCWPIPLASPLSVAIYHLHWCHSFKKSTILSIQTSIHNWGCITIKWPPPIKVCVTDKWYTCMCQNVQFNNSALWQYVIAGLSRFFV